MVLAVARLPGMGAGGSASPLSERRQGLKSRAGEKSSEEPCPEPGTGPPGSLGFYKNQAWLVLGCLAFAGAQGQLRALENKAQGGSPVPSPMDALALGGAEEGRGAEETG